MTGSGPRDRGRGGRAPGGLESLLDARTRSAEQFTAADSLAEPYVDDPLFALVDDPLTEPFSAEPTDVGLDRAVQRLAEELAHERAQGPSPRDVLGDVPGEGVGERPRTSAPAQHGRVVSGPPGAFAPRTASDPWAPARAMTMAAPGAAGASPRPVDTGPVPGDPFRGIAYREPMPAGQSQIGLGGPSAPFPSDFYGRDSHPPDVPGAVQAPVAAGAATTPLGAAYPDTDGAPPATAVPDLGADTERVVAIARPAPTRPSSWRWAWAVVAFGAVMVVSAVVFAVLGPWR